MTTLEIEIIAARHDNYIYLLFESATGTSGVVDPADADPVIEVLHTKGLGLQWILNTHHHDDHIGGNKELVATFGAKIVGPRADARRIPNMDLLVGEGDVFCVRCTRSAGSRNPRAYFGSHYLLVRAG